MSKRTNEEESLVSIAATKEEWKAVERIVTSYRQQCKKLHRYSPMLSRLDDFQRRFTQQTGFPSPDDYFI